MSEKSKCKEKTASGNLGYNAVLDQSFQNYPQSGMNHIDLREAALFSFPLYIHSASVCYYLEVYHHRQAAGFPIITQKQSKAW